MRPARSVRDRAPSRCPHGPRRRRDGIALTTRLYIAIAGMAAVTVIATLLLDGMRTG